MNEHTTTASPGQAIYTDFTLSLYDLVVLGISNHAIWRCPTRRLLAHYDQHVTSNHLDVGVGTGYFLDRCAFPTFAPRVVLMDPNRHALDFSMRRIARYGPEALRQDVLDAPIAPIPPFDSVGMNYLLHCMPGPIASKAIAFDRARALMKPGAVLFGSTLLQGGVERSRAARGLMKFYNRKGIFSNENDDLGGLVNELEQRFFNVSVEVVGCVALFSARASLGPRSTWA